MGHSLVGTWDVTLSLPGQPPGRVLATFAGDGTTVESAAAPGDASRRFARSVGADRAVSVLGHESLLQVQPAERCVSGHAEGERDGASRTGPQDVHRRVDLGAARPGRKPDRRWSAGHCTRRPARGRADPGSAVDDRQEMPPRHDRADRPRPRGGTCSCFTGCASRPEPRSRSSSTDFAARRHPSRSSSPAFGTRDPSAPRLRSAPRGTPSISNGWGRSGLVHGTRQFSCSDGTGSITARQRVLQTDLNTYLKGDWRIVDGNGPYAKLRGKGMFATVMGGDDFATRTFRETWNGVVDFDDTPPIVAITTARTQKLRRPAGAYNIRVALSARDEKAETAVAYKISIRSGDREAASRSGQTTSGTAWPRSVSDCGRASGEPSASWSSDPMR